jgi:hypothetical protein
LRNKLDFDPTRIGIQNPILKGLLSLPRITLKPIFARFLKLKNDKE